MKKILLLFFLWRKIYSDPNTSFSTKIENNLGLIFLTTFGLVYEIISFNLSRQKKELKELRKKNANTIKKISNYNQSNDETDDESTREKICRCLEKNSSQKFSFLYWLKKNLINKVYRE
jgi:hypothetical protein